MSKNVLLIIPTLNEFGNIQKIYKKIKKNNSDIKILFIDDNSEDGSQETIIGLKTKDELVDIVNS